jgi:precorrin-2 dehydrogenase/sirohydrochlorin ferrochelatase
MIPITIDPRQVAVGVIGRGPLLLRRLVQLVDLGAKPLVFCDEPTPEVIAAAGARLMRRKPRARDFHDLHVVWAAGLDARESAAVAADARAAKTLVNVEDDLPYCDFHTPAIVKRGQLLLSAATGGASPAAAKLARRTLEAAFPESWAEALVEATEDRARARAAGEPPPMILARAEAIFARRGLI